MPSLVPSSSSLLPLLLLLLGLWLHEATASIYDVKSSYWVPPFQRAEKLFAARDDDSEGRRRAVALNNMLFSAALSSRQHASANASNAKTTWPPSSRP